LKKKKKENSNNMQTIYQTGKIRAPAGIKFLRFFYLLLFFLNCFFVVLLAKNTKIIFFGQTTGGYIDLFLKAFLIVIPLVIFYMGFIWYQLYGCYLSIVYHGFFVVNFFVILVDKYAKPIPCSPLIMLVGDSASDMSTIIAHDVVYALNMLINSLICVYMLDKIKWYQGSKGYTGYDDRFEKRVNKELPFLYAISGSDANIFIPTNSRDISIDGVRASLAKSLRRGMRLNLEMRLLEETVPIKAKGKVIWCDGRECGIQFTSISFKNKKRLKKFTER